MATSHAGLAWPGCGRQSEENLKKINVGRGGWWQAAAADGLVSRAAAFNCNISDYNSVVRLTMADIEAR